MQVVKFIKAISPSLPVSVVHVRQYKTRDSPTANYDVQMASVEASAKIRDAYGAFWRKPKPGSAKPPIPAILNNVSISISHTFATRVRVKLMKQMAKLHQAANPDLNVFVTSFLPRPNLRIRHSGNRVDSYTFVEAIKRFGHHLTRDFLISETKYAKSNVSIDHLVPYFLVLSPDLILPSQPATPATQAKSQAPKRSAENPANSVSKKAKAKRKGRKVSTPAVITRSQPTSIANQFDALASPDALAESSFNANDPGAGQAEGNGQAEASDSTMTE